VKLGLRVNFTKLTSFNIVIICPVEAMMTINDIMALEGAAETQKGFIADKRKAVSKQKGMYNF
jgi:hypothetical protein